MTLQQRERELEALAQEGESVATTLWRKSTLRGFIFWPTRSGSS